MYDRVTLDAGSAEAQVRGGYYYTAHNPTLETAVTLTSADITAFDPTLPNLILYNASANKTATVRNVRYLITEAEAAPTSLQCLAACDRLDPAAFVTSSSNDSTVYRSSPGAPAPSCTLYIGEMIVGAATSGVVHVGRAMPVGTALIPGVSVSIVFGVPHEPFAAAAVGIAGTQYEAAMRPLVVPPGCSGLLYLWAADFGGDPIRGEFDVGWTEQ